MARFPITFSENIREELKKLEHWRGVLQLHNPLELVPRCGGGRVKFSRRHIDLLMLPLWYSTWCGCHVILIHVVTWRFSTSWWEFMKSSSKILVVYTHLMLLSHLKMLILVCCHISLMEADRMMSTNCSWLCLFGYAKPSEVECFLKLSPLFSHNFCTLNAVHILIIIKMVRKIFCCLADCIFYLIQGSCT